MSLNETFAKHFKPEIQKRGREDFAKGLAFITNASDTQVQGYVKGMPPLKVTFRSDTIGSSCFTASCTCSSALKGTFCKHMWTLLLAVEIKNPDFLDSKNDIEMGENTFEISKKLQQKKHYEKQKAWAQKKRQENKRKVISKATREKYSATIEKALDFFTQNGFVMEDLPNVEDLKKAKKHLARVFHPDKGGTHEEAVILNKHFEILSRFLAMISE